MKVMCVCNDIWMEFGVEKCAVLIMKKEKMANCDGIALPNKTNESTERGSQLQVFRSNTGRWNETP